MRCFIGLAVVAWLLGSCQQESLRKLLRAEVIERYRDDSLNIEKVRVIDEKGVELAHGQLDFREDKVFEFYENSKGEIREVMVFPMETFEDELYIIQLRLIPEFDPTPYIDPVNCEAIQQPIRDAGILDQRVRRGIVDTTMSTVDAANRRLVVSAIETCGFPKMEEIGKLAISSIWIILQHAPNEMMAYYFGYLEQAVYQGSLEHHSFALMQDRLLMYNGYPQVYGTQYRYGQFYQLRDPPNVNARRSSMGLPAFDQWQLENVVGVKPIQEGEQFVQPEESQKENPDNFQ